MVRRKIIAELMLEAERAETFWVCQDCLGNRTLKSLSPSVMEDHVCNVCDQQRGNVLTPKRIASFLKPKIPNIFVVSPESQIETALSLEQVVGDIVESNSEPLCTAIATALRENGDGPGDFYKLAQTYIPVPGPSEFTDDIQAYVSEEWNKVRLDLVHGQRFFNEKARSFFETLIFEALSAKDLNEPEKKAVILDLPAGTRFYRARVAASVAQARDYAKDAERELGAPPKERAANGRMNASGVPLLYLAKELDTCIAETRPSIDDIVAVGCFISTAPLRFFDFGALKQDLHFEPLDRLQPWADELGVIRRFLEHLHDEIAKPVRVHDQDYVVTQALAEFIRFFPHEKFDGISFQSVQRSGGTNYVLFENIEALNPNAPPLPSAARTAQAVDTRLKFGVSLMSSDVVIHRVREVHYTSAPVCFLER
ncbi:RES family NAD+ phosphorylase [Delftia lacustris]|uniref:RES family NAD+ phosphorylase n=1 Tax=Delftia lacustris TaxID=558537 RepID=UPI00193BD155|nr:RES family NAD+ phosphorylase [Delftia lacustris]QRI92959.1 RES family NAD+ phosphorylase [Delftia lacustris]